MFRFLRPVKPLVFLACLWLTLWVVMEVLAIRQAGNIASFLQNEVRPSQVAATGGMRVHLRKAGRPGANGAARRDAAQDN